MENTSSHECSNIEAEEEKNPHTENRKKEHMRSAIERTEKKAKMGMSEQQSKKSMESEAKIKSLLFPIDLRLFYVCTEK